ncbi:MAG TPA: KUP/HAK/KT family potassium transporter, partial [Polyangiaceae bacterium]|nr:KUP/HAK/KT family potassium transporter [Polyangiaceae bacterium]
FLVIDLAFLGANLIKIHDGGWFPLVIGVAVFTALATWKRGRTILADRFREQLVPLDDFFELMRIERPARVPGVAVFMTSNASGCPPPLMQNFMLNRVVHQHVVLLTVTTEEVPWVDESQRLDLEELPAGFCRLRARYGFMQTPDVPALLAQAKVPDYAAEHTTFVLGRETVLASERPGMAVWRERLFAFMARNAQSATAFFGLPSERVLEIGTQVDL